jgi:hypothetical protein
MTEQPELPSEPINHDNPIRASFSMDRGSREAIRWMAERYGVDQSDIVNLAPVLFAILAEASLNKRRDRLAQVETAARQAERNIVGIKKLAHHLGIFTDGLLQALEMLLEGERASIESNHVIEVGYGVMEVHGGTDSFLGRLTDDGKTRPDQNMLTSPLINALRELAEAAGVTVDQDRQGDNGAPAHPYSMILKLGDGGSGNLAVAAHERFCRVTEASSMDEAVVANNEGKPQANWLTPFLWN